MATTPVTPATPTIATPKIIPISGWLMLGALGLIILFGIIALVAVNGLPSIPEDWKDHGVSQTTSSSSSRTSNETPARPDYVAAQQPPVSVVINNNQPAPVVQPPAEEEEVEVEEKPVVAEQPKPAVALPVVENLGQKCSLFFTVTDGQFGYPTKAEVKGLDGSDWVQLIEGPIVTNKAGVGQVPLNGPAGTLRRGGFRCKNVSMLKVYLDFNDLTEKQRDNPDFISFEVDDEDGNSESYSTLRVDKDSRSNTYAFLVQALGTTKDGVYH